MATKNLKKQVDKINIFPARFLTHATVLIPYIGLVGCLITAVIRYPTQALNTECESPNYLPSLSTGIGQFQPQQIIWQLIVTMSATPRLLLPYILTQKYNAQFGIESKPPGISRLLTLANILFYCEIVSVLGLSYYTTSTNARRHQKCIITYLICNILLHPCHLILRRWRLSPMPSDEVEKWNSYRRHYTAFLTSTLLLTVFYCFHIFYCTPYMYTCFSICEYISITYIFLLSWMINQDGFEGFNLVLERVKLD